MWRENKKEKSQGTPSILVRKRPIPSQSFQNSNSSVGKEFEIRKPSSSTSANVVTNNKDSDGMFMFFSLLKISRTFRF